MQFLAYFSAASKRFFQQRRSKFHTSADEILARLLSFRPRQQRVSACFLDARVQSLGRPLCKAEYLPTRFDDLGENLLSHFVDSLES
jgi:hypothetical protein